MSLRPSVSARNTALAPGALAPATSKRPTLTIETETIEDWELEIAEAALSPGSSPKHGAPTPQRSRIFSTGKPIGGNYSPSRSPNASPRSSPGHGGGGVSFGGVSNHGEGGSQPGGGTVEQKPGMHKRSMSAEQRDQRDRDTVFAGFGKAGYFFPNAFLSLPFAIRGTVLPHVAGFMVMAGAMGGIALAVDNEVESTMHELMGFVIGFLLIILGNFSQVRNQRCALQLPASVCLR